MRTRRVLPFVAVLLAVSPPFTARADESNHTVTWWCTDASAALDVGVPVALSRSALTRPAATTLPPCPTATTWPVTVPAGSRWASGGFAWVTNSVYPPAVRAALTALGYRFAADKPHEDFVRKVKEVRYDVTTVESGEAVATFRFDARDRARVIEQSEWAGARPLAGFDVPELGISIDAKAAGKLPQVGYRAVAPPLPAGAYFSCVTLTLVAQHNDGLGLEAGNFIPAGEWTYGCFRFVVSP